MDMSGFQGDEKTEVCMDCTLKMIFYYRLFGVIFTCWMGSNF